MVIVPKKYNYSADVMRVLALLFVVFIHSGSSYLTSTTDFSSLNWWFITFLQTFAKIAVPLFVMLSGVLLLDSAKSESLNVFYKKRLLRVGIPLLVWPFVYYIGFTFVTGKNFSLENLVNDYIFLGMFYHLYFLYIIVGLYAITPFLRKMWRSLETHEKKIFILGSLATATLVTLTVYFTKTKLSYWSVLTVYMPFIGYFLAGEFLQKLQLLPRQLKVVSAVFMVTAVFLVIGKYIAFSANQISWQRYFNDVLSLPMIVLSITGFLQLQHFTTKQVLLENNKLKQLIKKLAVFSFGIYIIHPVFIFVYEMLVSTRFSVIPTAAILLETIIVILVSWMVVGVASKIPYVKALFGN